MQSIFLDIDGKSARVQLQALLEAQPRPEVVLKTESGRVETQRVLTGVKSVAEVAFQDLCEGDPELCWERAGEVLDRESLTTAYFDPEAKIPSAMGEFSEVAVVYEPSGAEKERRPFTPRRSNINGLHPLKVGKRFPLKQALTQFVFRQHLQIVHTDSLTFDFLHGFAKELHEKLELAVLGAGVKGAQPLVLRDKGAPYRAFLYGEVDNDRYRLLLLLSDMELKHPDKMV